MDEIPQFLNFLKFIHLKLYLQLVLNFWQANRLVSEETSYYLFSQKYNIDPKYDLLWIQLTCHPKEILLNWCRNSRLSECEDQYIACSSTWSTYSLLIFTFLLIVHCSFNWCSNSGKQIERHSVWFECDRERNRGVSWATMQRTSTKALLENKSIFLSKFPCKWALNNFL